MAAMFAATSAAPLTLASKEPDARFRVPTRTRSSLLNTGRLIAPGKWSSANSAGVLTSITGRDWLAGSSSTLSIDRICGVFKRRRRTRCSYAIDLRMGQAFPTFDSSLQQSAEPDR
jgi:hypothetical protein